MRYTTNVRIRADYKDDVPMLPVLTIFEEVRGPVHTGLVDQWGQAIYRLPETVRMGFEC